MDERALILDLARRHRLGDARFAAVGPTPHFAACEAWLAAGRHGEMGWMERALEVRADPRARLPSAKTAVVLALRHAHLRPPDPGGRTGLVARYAWGRDYHNLLGKRVARLARDLRAAGIAAWGGVDTAPIVERAWAEAAGIAAIGKNTLALVPGKGSWSFLAVVFVAAEIAPDPPFPRDPCGSCTRCLAACPTGAFPAPRVLDATRCISYWTIEARGLAPETLRPGFGRWVFGCDVCQEVCPHNHAPPACDEEDLLPRHAWLDLDELLLAPDEALLARFTGTPLRRPGAAGLKRNAAIALGNLGDPGGRRALASALSHPTEVVREAAAWALQRL
jgi:epoxyqueuosine reductase